MLYLELVMIGTYDDVTLLYDDVALCMMKM